MATADFYIAKNDALPVISATLQNADSTIVDLTGGSTQLIAINADSGAITTATASLVGPATDGTVSATFPTTVSGLFNCRWVVTFGGSSTESFPNNDYFLVEVFDGGPGVILTNKADLDAVISILGVTLNDFSYADIQSIGFLQAAEAKITDTLSAQSGYGTTVPNVAQIMAGTGTATPLDKTHLKAAVVYQLAYLFGPGETNSVDVSQAVGPVSRDLGGIGETWIHQMQEYEIQCDYHISKITNFKKWRTL